MKNSQNKKRIWIDLDNSPHVPFFSPIIGELNKLGYEVLLTARDCSQTCGLADLFHLQYKRIGRHYGKHKIFKVAGTVFRALTAYAYCEGGGISSCLVARFPGANAFSLDAARAVVCDHGL